MSDRYSSARTSPARRDVLAALRRIASEGDRAGLGKRLRQGRTVYQDAGEGRVERIEPDGTRTAGHFVDRRFIPDRRK